MIRHSLAFLVIMLLLTGAVPVRADANLQAMLAAPAIQSGEAVLDRAALAAVYTPRNFAPIWTKRGQVDALLTTFNQATIHGLNPADYHVQEITAALGGDKLMLDLLLTDALMRYVSDVRVGRVSPRAIKGERFTPTQKIDLVAAIAAAAQAPDLPAHLATLPPQSAVYQGLVQALAVLRAQAVLGDWPRINDGRKIEPGNTSPRVPQLRARLGASGELGQAELADSQVYDEALVQAVKAYQARSGLEPDGVVGRATIAMLNVPLAQRIDQIRANMERLRWQADDLGQRYVYVNIPAYQLVAVSNGQVDLNMRVVVGRPKRSTPSFADAIRIVEFNPDWHVPPTIAREDVLPGLIENPNWALEKKNVRIYQAGVEVDPHTVDWTTADIRDYRLRAEPGPRNPLGTVKFLFPNRFDVYLHDTNERDLFEKDVRAISSGCVRIEDPAAFANWLLGPDRPDWSDERRTKILDSRRQTRLNMNAPVPVYLAYITAWQGDDGRPVFRDDIYGQDAVLIAALQQADAKSRRLVASMVRGSGQNTVEPTDVPAEELQKAAP